MAHFTQIVFNSKHVIVTKKTYESQDLMKIILNKITFHTHTLIHNPEVEEETTESSWL